MAEAVKKPVRKKKKKTVWIICAIAALILILYFVLRPDSGIQDNLVSTVDLTELFTTDIEYTISGTGKVESELSHKLYASQNYKIEKVLVEVGDTVSVGQKLLDLDTSALEDQIETKEVSMDVTAMNQAQQIKTAEDNYRAVRDGIKDGTNASLISAEQGVQNAYDNWQRQLKTYNDYLASLNNGTNASLIAQDTQSANARTALDQANEAYEDAKAARDKAEKKNDEYKPNLPSTREAQAALTATMTKEAQAQEAYNSAFLVYEQAQKEPENTAALEAARSAYVMAEQLLQAAKAQTAAAQAAYNLALSGADPQKAELEADYEMKKAQAEAAKQAQEQAQSAFDAAARSQNAAQVSANTALEDYKKAVDSAHTAYEMALKSQTATEVSVDNSLQQSRNSLSSAQIAANTELSDLEYERMLENLADATVLADEAGTVTAVYAAVGSVASGILFVIEDTQSLLIETTISEYDVATIKPGMEVHIRAEAAKDAVYQGRVLSVAPTSNKNAMGDTDRMGDTVFATKISVESKDTDLRIGMSVRLEYIVESAESILAVPHDSIYVNDDGEDCIMVLEAPTGGSMLMTEGESYVLREIPVICGLENDLLVTVSGRGLTDGAVVVNTASNYRHLVGGEIVLTDQILSGANDLMPPMMMW